MKKLLLLIIIIALAGIHASAQQRHVSEITLEPGERWWGTDIYGLSWDRYSATAHTDPFVTDMLVSSAGRYLWSAQPMRITTDGRKLSVESESERVEVQKAGKTLREAYIVCIHKNFYVPQHTPSPNLLTRPVYRPANRPDVTWGQREIMDFARRIISEGLPPGTIVIPEGWCSPNAAFTFSQELFPDPIAMITELYGMGFGAMLTVTPRILSTGRQFSEAHCNGNIVRDQQTHLWSILDMGDDAVFDRFRKEFADFKAKYPFDGYRLECRYTPQSASDPFLTNWEKLADGIVMCEMSGCYERPFTPYVSESVDGGSPFGSVFAASLSGSIYKTPATEPPCEDDETRARHMVCALFFPVGTVDFLPWELGDQRLRDRVKTALTFRASLAEYMDNLLRESVRTGEPIVRHMEYQFPRQGFTDCDDQFMLGSKYLIVACCDGRTKCMVRLPKGRWADSRGNRFKGPLVTEADCTSGPVYYELVK